MSATGESGGELAALIPRVNEGDSEALEQLLTATWPRLLRRVRTMLGESARRVAESGDYLNDMYVVLLRDLGGIAVQSVPHFVAIATRIARHQIIDTVQSGRARRFESFATAMVQGDEVQDDAGTPSRAAAEADEIERALSALEQLPDGQRAVVELRHLEDASFRAIGERIGKSENAAQLLHARALTRLGELLG